MDNNSPRKRSAAESPSSQPDFPHKRLRLVEGDPHVESTPAHGPSRNVTKKRKEKVLREWGDIPKWMHDKCPFLESMPVELLDKITETDSGLELQDHLALAGSCRVLRSAYTEEIWKSLYIRSLNPYSPQVNHIFSSLESFQSKGARMERKPNRSTGSLSDVLLSQSPTHEYCDDVVKKVNKPSITKTNALQRFKISEKELLSLKCEQRRNPHRNRGGAPMRLYVIARVRALTLRLHGGPLGHAAYLKKLAETAAKTRATKERNGTTPKKKVYDPSAFVGDYDDYDYGGYGLFHDTPSEEEAMGFLYCSCDCC